MKSTDLITTARSYIGTPFVHQGRIPGKALDCAGLVACSIKQNGIKVNDVVGYGRNPSCSLLEKALNSEPNLVKVHNNEMQAGDILLMRFASEPQHLAIYTGKENNSIIHAYLHVEQVVEHRLSDMWLHRITAVYRIKDITI